MKFFAVIVGAIAVTTVSCTTSTSNNSTSYNGTVYSPIWGNCISYSVHAGTAVSFNGELTTVETGDVGVAPGTGMTGNYVTSSGASHLNDASAIACFNDKIGILNALQAMICTVSLPGPELGGTTLTPGVMCYAAMSLTGTVTLDGQNNASSVFVFQTSKELVVNTGGTVNLINGAQAKNVYWAIGSSATIAVSSYFKGSIVAGASISLDTNSRMLGRAIAGAAVSFAGLDAIALPADSYTIATNVSVNGTRNSTTQTTSISTKLTFTSTPTSTGSSKTTSTVNQTTGSIGSSKTTSTSSPNGFSQSTSTASSSSTTTPNGSLSSGTSISTLNGSSIQTSTDPSTTSTQSNSAAITLNFFTPTATPEFSSAHSGKKSVGAFVVAAVACLAW